MVSLAPLENFRNDKYKNLISQKTDKLLKLLLKVTEIVILHALKQYLATRCNFCNFFNM